MFVIETFRNRYKINAQNCYHLKNQSSLEDLRPWIFTGSCFLILKVFKTKSCDGL